MKSQEELNNIASNSNSGIREISQPFNETLGGEIEYESLMFTRIIEPVLSALSETKDANIIKEVKELVSIIFKLVLELNKRSYDTSNLPSLTAANLEDGSFLIEWLFPSYRVGFVIDSNPKESMWYLVSKSEYSGSNQWGILEVNNKKELITSLVSHVASNS
jgi:hypothetical protein